MKEIPLTNQKVVRTVDFSPDGSQFVVGQAGDGTGAANLTLWDAETHQLAVEIEYQSHDTILKARFSPDGRFLFYVDSTHTVRQYDCTTQETRVIDIPDLNVDWLAFGARGSRMVAAGALTTVWDVEQEAALWTSPEEAVAVIYEGQPAIGALSPEGTQIAVAGMVEHEVLVYDVESGEVVQVLPDGPERAARWSAFDPTGRYLAVIAYGGEDLLLWDVETGERHFPELPLSGFLCLAFHPSGRYLALGKLSGVVKVMDVEAGASLFSERVHHRRVWDLAFSPDGRLLISGGEGGACVWQLDERFEMRRTE